MADNDNGRLSDLEVDELYHAGVTGGDDYLVAAVEEIRALRREAEARKVVDELDTPPWRRPTDDDLPAWNSDPMTDDDMNFLRAFVRSMVDGGHRNIAEIISHAENQIIELRAQVSTLRADRRDAWLNNARLRSRLIAADVPEEELLEYITP
jgi:hypothetical protein